MNYSLCWDIANAEPANYTGCCQYGDQHTAIIKVLSDVVCPIKQIYTKRFRF